jgi:large subunit ribosomal protein L21
MYAIIEIAGQQFKVEKDQKIFIHRLEQKEGSQIDIDSVLLLDNDKNVLVGEPTISGARIVARVLSHLKGDKIKIFKKKRRKGYQVLNAHRQQFTQIRIEEIIEKISKKETHAAESIKKTAIAPEGEQTGKAVKKEAVTATTGGKAQAGTTPARKVSPKKAPGPAAKEEKPAVKKAVTKKPAPPAAEKTAGKAKTSGAKTAGKQKTGEKKAVAKKSETKSTKKK